MDFNLKNDDDQVKLFPLINCIQKITVYETTHSFYIVGSNIAETYFKVLKLDRTCDTKTLEFSEDVHEYDKEEIEELLVMINVANTSKGSTSNNGIIKSHQGYGIVGFVKFLYGYYMILITKQLPVAIIGYHTIYTIDDAIIIYIPNEDKSIRENNIDEQKYLKLFQTVDLRQNFYYSHTYDITNPLQYNLADIKDIAHNLKYSVNQENHFDESDKFYGIVTRPCSKYIWNDYLLKPIRNKVSHHWILNIIHGFLSQSSLNIFGCSIFTTLISRRSQKYAGTRFLKRGGTKEGFVANEVETEQIVHNACVSSFKRGNYTSFVHMRGSIPLFWSQDPRAVPKPPINIDIFDPFSTVAANHFKQLFKRFGAPLIILNLVKMREKKASESTLAIEYKLAVEYLQQFLPNNSYFQYIYFDMAKLNKMDKGNVMGRLYDIAESIVTQTGFFQNFTPTYSSNTSNYNQNNMLNMSGRQIGIVRVNCVDCLDRTNTAMYVIGKCAFAYQLHALGILPAPMLEPDSLYEKMLIDLYEKSGDAIAQQYAGSQLVHRVDTYGTKSSLANQSRDFVHTISRYYSNAFSDADKQNAMNLFLGIFEPQAHSFPIWELTTDCYLHDPYLMEPWKKPKKYNNWISDELFNSLPLPIDQEKKNMKGDVKKIEKINREALFKIDAFNNFYKPFRLTVFHETYYFNTLQTNRLNPNPSSTGLTGHLKAIINPFLRDTKRTDSLTNQSISSQTNLQSNISSDSDTDESFTIVNPEISSPRATIKENQKQNNNKDSLVNIVISDRSMDLYRFYINESKQFEPNKTQFSHLFCMNKSKEEIIIPKVNEKSRNLYADYIKRATYGPKEPSTNTIQMYETYLNNLRSKTRNETVG